MSWPVRTFFITVCLSIFICPDCYSQQSQADSLLSIIKAKPDDPAKVKELATLSEKIASFNPQGAVQLAKYIIELSATMKYEQGVAIGYNELGHAYERYSVNDSAFHYFFLSKNIFSQLNNPGGIANSLYNLGSLHEIMGRLDSAAFYLFQSLVISDSIKDTDLKGKNQRAIGNVLSKQNRLDEALENYFSALTLFNVKNDLPELIARVQENIALIYIKKELFAEAENYFDRALAIYTAIDESRGLARVRLNIATLRSAQGNYEEALADIFYALDFFKKIDHLNGIAEAMMQLSDVYLKMKNYNEAIRYANNTLGIVRKSADKDTELEALRYLQKAYFAKGDYKMAYYYLNRATEFNESFFNEKKESMITELRTKYEMQKKESEIALLNKSNENKVLEVEKQRILKNSFLGVAVLILALGFLFVNRMQLRKKIEKQEAVLDERKRISNDMHDDLGSHLSKISLLSQVMKQQSDNEKEKEELEKISSSARGALEKMSEIVWTLNSKNDTLQNLLAYIRKYAMEYFEQTPIECRINYPDAIPERMLNGEHRRSIFLSVKEALHNVIKHSGANKVDLSFSIGNGYYLLAIRDNGKGISENNNHSGNGLHNMKNRIESMKGNFNIDGNEGTTVKLSFPVSITSV